jgi:hypothetical protein
MTWAVFSGCPLDRDDKRQKSLLFKWFDDHWDILEPLANATELEIAQMAVRSDERRYE